MRGLALLLLFALAWGLDLNSIKNEGLNYANQAGNLSNTAKSQAENIVCTQGGADCSYHGQDYRSFSREDEARQEYLNQANDPNSALGRALSTIWNTSDVKSTLFYQEAQKLYQCDRVSPDGRCERYVGENYYGECQTVTECVSQTTQQTYAEYMCYIDAQGQTTAGETRHLCYVYNTIEPTVKEKEYVCHVVNTESIKTCTKERRVNFGVCQKRGSQNAIAITGSFNAGSCVYYIAKLEITENSWIFYSGDSSPRRCYGLCRRVKRVAVISFSGVRFLDTGVYTIPVRRNPNCGRFGAIVAIEGLGNELEIRLVDSGNNGLRVWKKIRIRLQGATVWGLAGFPDGYAPAPGTGGISNISLIAEGNRLKLYRYAYYHRPDSYNGEVVFCPEGSIYDASTGQCVGYKCSLNNQTYASKSKCYANCYTESINDCTVQ